MRAATIAAYDSDAVVRAFNRGYEQYYVPVTLEKTSLENSRVRYGVRFDLSPAFVDASDEMSGFAFLALRERRAWIWAIAVAIEWRRQGLASRLIERAIDNAVAAGAETIELEVLQANEPALALYHAAGFQIMEELIGFEREPHPSGGPGIDLRWTPGAEILACLPPQPPHERCWQRQRATLQAIDPLWAVSRPLAPEVHAFYTYGERDVRLADWMVEDAEDARVLTAALASTFPGRHLHLPNERASAITARLPAIGWKEVWRQFRMVRAL